ncbi:MAG: exosortase/archaeosortase family protein [Verrucomicrobia bacterium]|nr:exosortase/archaeosortase family protein [Verrucomicrobiota bacterium]MBI3868570.1 exosortase/archaeosortase family protein [Verrucomicrobiota bacterium]
MSETKSESRPRSLAGDFWDILAESRRFLSQLPDKALFGVALVAWVALFQFYGNSTLGYVNTPSLFGWLRYVYRMSDGDSHGLYMPWVVLGLAYWKREEILAAPRSRWWPAVLLVALGLSIHIAGYVIQQTRVSIVGFFVGVYGLMGMVWGWRWLLATFFPFCLFVFCVPLATETDRITLPLRLMATSITSTFCHTVLGIDLVRQGTMIYDAKGQYQYEIAAACSGIKSLSATVAIAIIGGFISFKAPWRRALMFVSAFPLAVLGNVLRLTTIIVASEAFGQSAGQFVHDNSVLSLLPYIPAIGGVALLMRFLDEHRPPPADPGAAPQSPDSSGSSASPE